LPDRPFWRSGIHVVVAQREIHFMVNKDGILSDKLIEINTKLMLIRDDQFKAMVVSFVNLVLLLVIVFGLLYIGFMIGGV
jgi:hypothetical protein